MGAGVRPRRVASRLIVATAGLVVLAAGCNLISPLDPSLRAGFLTTDGDDDYGITIAGAETVAAAPTTNTGGSTRVAYWNADGESTPDHMSCMTWTEGDHLVQQGVAMRVRSEAGRVRAITVTKNIYGGFWWIFNIHVMDSGSETPFVKIASIDVSGSLLRDGVAVPGPWRLCAQVVGDQVAMKVWPASEPEPEWMDGVHGGGVVLPSGWGDAGVPGWYVGHLRPGVSTSYVDRVTAPIAPEPPTTETTVPSTTTTTEAPTSTTTTTEAPTTTVTAEALPDDPPATTYAEPTAILQAP